MTWAYVYFMKDDAARVREVTPRHARYWSEPVRPSAEVLSATAPAG